MACVASREADHQEAMVAFRILGEGLALHEDRLWRAEENCREATSACPDCGNSLEQCTCAPSS